MRPIVKRRLRRFGTASVIAAAPLAVLCAYVTNLLVPTEPLAKPVHFEYIPTAGIVESGETIGIADSDLYDPNLSEADVIAHFDQMQALGVDTVRVLVPWGAIQPAEPGSPLEQFFPPDWSRIDLILSQAQERDMAVLGVLNATPYWGGQDGSGCLGCPGVAPDATKFAAFAGEAVARFNDLFPGVVSAYEVWNEPNSFRSWSPAVDPVAYTNVLKAAYDAIKNANGIPGADPGDPTVVAGVLGAVITFGGFTMDPVTFVETMYANGAEGYFDALSYHPYNYDRMLSEQNPNFLSPIRALLEMRQLMIDNGDEELRIWASEYGLPTALVTEEEQRDFIRDFLVTWADGLSDEQLAQLPDDFQGLAESWEEWVGPAFIYSLRDRLGLEDTEQGSFGLYYFDEETQEWKLKPAGLAVQELIKSRQQQDLAGAINKALQQLVQQVAQVLGQTIVNGLAQALANWLNSLGQTPSTAATTLALTSEERLAVAEGTTMAVAEAQSTVDESTDALGSAATSELAEGAEAEGTEPEATEGTESEVTETEEAESEVTETEVTDPPVKEPEVTEPEVTEPPVTEPEVTEPEVTEPEVTEPEDVGTEEPAEEPGNTDEPPVSEEPETELGNRDETQDESTVDPEEDTDTDSDLEGDFDSDLEGDIDSDLEGDFDSGTEAVSPGGKHAQGNVENGTSVGDIKDRLGKEASGDPGSDAGDGDGSDAGGSEKATA